MLPEGDKSSISRNELLNQLAYALGGLAAEQLIFHDPTTGSSNDIEKATKVARAMVTSYGMSERLGAVKLGEDNSEPFLGRDFGHTRNYSEEIAAIIDEEINKLLTNAHQEAFDILVQNRDVLDTLVTELLEKETIDRKGLADIFSEIQMRPERPAWTGSDTRIPSTIPPVDVPAGLNGRPEPAARSRCRRARRPPSRRCPATGANRPTGPPGVAAAVVRRSGRRWAPRTEMAIDPVRRCPATATVPDFDHDAGRGRRPRAADRHRRGSRPRGAAGHARAGSPARTPRCSAACG